MGVLASLHPPLRRLLRLPASWLMCLVLLGLPGTGHAEPASGEYSLKAAFIYNFTKFVEWPESALRGKSEFCIATLGRTPLDRNLAALSGRTVQGRPIVFRQVSSAEEAAQCQVLFIARSELSRTDAILENLADLPVLTIADRDDFCKRGGMLSLYQDNGRIAFEINLHESQRCRLRVSSQLLRLAKKIYGHQ